MSCDFGLRGFAAACSAQKPGVRQTVGIVVLVVLDVLVDVDELVLLEVDELVLLDVDELVLLEVLELVDELEVLELVELLVLLDVLELLLEVLELVELLVLLDVLELVELLVLLEVLVLVDVLVVVVMTSAPRSFSERNGSSTVASWSAPSAGLSTAPDWSPARVSATALVTPGLTVIVHICGPPIADAGVPAGRSRLVVRTTGFAKSGIPSRPGQ